MEAMRQSWTDDRLDDLSHRMDERFDQVEGEMNQRLERVEGAMKELRAEVKDQGKELRGEIAGVEARLRTQANEHRAETWEQFDRVHEDMRQIGAAILGLHQTMTRIAWSAGITLLAGAVGVLLTNL
jgi:chromosome segregation ATPase